MATGKTVEEARKELISVIEGWIALWLRMGRSIPPNRRSHDNSIYRDSEHR